MTKIQVKLLNKTAVVPKRANEGDAGYDLCSIEEVTLWPGERRLVKTGIAIQLPEDHVGLVHPRSGLAHKKGVTVLNAPGTIDSGYTGEIMVNLINLGDSSVFLAEGDRIAQLVIQKVEHPEFNIVHDLSATARGNNGHGSSGQ